MKTKKPSDKYWRERALQRENLMQQRGTKTIHRVTQAYDRAVRNINDEINKIFERYAKDGKLSPDKVRKLLNNAETDDVIAALREKIDTIEDAKTRRELHNRINAPAYAARMTRLEAVKENVYVEMKKTAGEEIMLDRALCTDTYKDSYYRTIFDIQKGIGVGFDFALLPKKAIDEVLNQKFLGKNFSKRVWKNTDVLAKKAQETIETGIMTGVSIEQMSSELEESSIAGKSAATRLVRTETNYFMGQGELASYRECGITKYRYLATLDSRTSAVCAGMDGQSFEVDKAAAGVNYPPMHPYCRSTTVADLGGLHERIARAEDGSTYKVDGDMTYGQWKEKYVDNAEKRGIMNVRGGVKTVYSGAFYGALNPESDKDFARCEEHAMRYYEEIRKRTSDVSAIAKNTGYTEQEIQIIKSHIFINKYDLGEDEPTRFYPSYDIAVSWQNLIDGHNIEEKDKILLQHEYYEYNLMMTEGLPYVQAHEKAQGRYNYKKAVDDWRAKK